MRRIGRIPLRMGSVLLMSGDGDGLRDDYATAVSAPLPASVPASVDSGTARGSLEKVSDASDTGSIASSRLKLSGAAAATYRFEAHGGVAINSDEPFVVSFVYKHTSGAFEIGLYSDNTASGNPTAGLFPTATELQLKIGADVIEAYDLTADADYRITIEYDGAYTKWLIKGGSEYSDWTEIYRTRLISWGANSYFLVKNTNAVVEFDETRIQRSYVFDTDITIYPTFRVETSGADTFDPAISTSSGTGTWQYGDGSADEVTNTVSHAISGAQKMLVRLTNLASANILVLDSGNDKLTGDLDAIVSASLTNLTQLLLTNNLLSGSIPTELGNLTSLTQLHLNTNSLSGNIPTELGNLTSLTQLRFNNNSLSGNIPTELGNLTSLTDLRFTNNSLSGNIPTELGNLTNLTILYLQNNSFDVNGNFAGTLSAISDMRLENNGFSQAEVDAVVADLYSSRAIYTNATPALNIAGTNAAPSGTYQIPPSCASVVDGKEQIYELVNDSCSDGHNQWTITYTA